MEKMDTQDLKRRYPLEQVLARYGVRLQPSGRTLLGRCPFHPDRGRPNLVVYPREARYYCYRCQAHGDVFTLVEQLEGVGFRQAVACLTGGPPGPVPPAEVPSSGEASLAGPGPVVDAREQSRPEAERPGRHGRGVVGGLGPAERAVLAAAVACYQGRLARDRVAQRYLVGRGLSRTTMLRYRLGYAAGHDLAPALRRWHLPLSTAHELGLLRSDGRDFLAGRVVIPELRGGRPVWLTGRRLAEESGPAGANSSPKYLDLPGPKPLLGWEEARSAPWVLVVEGAFDWLTLRQWGLPALALNGSHASPTVLAALARFPWVYLALDADVAGQAGTAALCAALGERAVPLCLPAGVRDVGELAPRRDGAELLVAALRQAGRPA